MRPCARSCILFLTAVFIYAPLVESCVNQGDNCDDHNIDCQPQRCCTTLVAGLDCCFVGIESACAGKRLGETCLDWKGISGENCCMVDIQHRCGYSLVYERVYCSIFLLSPAQRLHCAVHKATDEINLWL